MTHTFPPFPDRRQKAAARDGRAIQKTDKEKIPKGKEP